MSTMKEVRELQNAFHILLSLMHALNAITGKFSPAFILLPRWRVTSKHKTIIYITLTKNSVEINIYLPSYGRSSPPLIWI